MHKHYVGSAHTFEILNQNQDRPDVTVLKTFFIDDTVNENDWQATWEGLKKDAEDLLGIPLVLQEDLEHPKFSVQQMYDRGTIFDYDIDEPNHKIIVYVRITDPTVVERIKSGELEYVSPAVIPRGSETMNTVGGVDILGRTLPLHLAIVGNPAYGKMKAKMSDMCSGDGKECYHRLKMMSASAQVKEIIKREHELLDKGIDEEKVHKILKQEFESDNGDGGDGDGGNSGIKSKLKILNADSASDVVGPLTQIPYKKKIAASLTRLGSIFDQMKSGSAYPMLNGKEGYWIKAKEQDVFVARNQSINQALLEQCGCSKLGATETKLDWKKMDKKKANYHKADSVKNCRNCKFFNIYRDNCQVVEGFIEPFYISDLWQPKE